MSKSNKKTNPFYSLKIQTELSIFNKLAPINPNRDNLKKIPFKKEAPLLINLLKLMAVILFIHKLLWESRR
jgi:hypothetical protein